MTKLTDMTLQKLPIPAAGQITYDDEGSPLKVRVSQGGSKTFIVLLGSGRRHTIGRYGEVTLQQARDAARRLRAEKTLGRIFPERISLADVRTKYLADVDLRPSTKGYTVRNLDRFSSTKLSDITPREVTKILDGLTPSSATQCLRVYSAFFNWCIRKHYLDRSPVERMQAEQSTSRARVLSDAELQLIYKATAEPTHFNTIVRLLLLTGQRRTEIASLHTLWIKDNQITLPSSVTKNGKEHTFPIGTLTCSLLPTALDGSSTASRILFPARGTTGAKSFNGWSKSKASLDKASGVTGWTLHDLRRTFATKHAALGTPIHVIEKLLNHVSGTISGVAAIYNRHQFWEEQVQATSRYEAHLLELFR